MRGVALRGRRWPANRSAGPGRRWFRQPYLGARGAVTRSAALPPPTGPCPQGRTRGTTARRSITTRHSAAHGSAARRTRFATGSPARWHPVEDRDNDVARHRPDPVTCTGSRCRQPPGVTAVPAAAGGPARTAPARAGISPPQARPRPEPCRACLCPSGPWTVRPAQARSAGPRGSVPRRRVKPCPPYQPPLPRGPWPLLSRTRSRADLAGQHLAGTGHRPDLCPYRQPGATSCRACRMFPIACYGLTPRCREVKRL
jgi:hypothetical protein